MRQADQAQPPTHGTSVLSTLRVNSMCLLSPTDLLPMRAGLIRSEPYESVRRYRSDFCQPQ